MIIPSNTPKSPLPQVEPIDPDSHPPSYTPSSQSQILLPLQNTNTNNVDIEAAPARIVLNTVGQRETDPLLASPAVHKPQSARKRFCIAYFWGILIVFIFSSFINFSFHSEVTVVDYPWFHDENYVLPEGIKQQDIVDCAIEADWMSGSFTNDEALEPLSANARAAYRIPIVKESLLYFGSTGYMYGDLNVITNPILEDAMLVEVELGSNLDQLYLCRVQNKEKNGMIAVVPLMNSGNKLPVIGITIVLPQETTNILPGLDINVRNFEVSVTEIEHLQFAKASIRTTDNNVHIDTLSAATALVKTSGASIKGAFITSKNLDLRTSGRPIDVSVNLVDNPGSNDTPSVTMITSRREILSRLSLTGTPNSTFLVDGKTNRGGLIDYHVYSQPLNSKLFMSGRTSQALIKVELAPEFEGGFSMTTLSEKRRSNKHTIRVKEDEVDPSGQGRKRTVQSDAPDYGSTMSGFVYWGDRGPMEGDGTINLLTTDHPITLNV